LHTGITVIANAQRFVVKKHTIYLSLRNGSQAPFDRHRTSGKAASSFNARLTANALDYGSCNAEI
jgi:hypothetical protein